MRMITRKKPAFTELYQTGVLTRIAAVKSPDGGGWRLFGLWRGKDIAVFVEAARGGIREWSGLDYLANFCASCGISLWEVHNKVTEKPPQRYIIPYTPEGACVEVEPLPPALHVKCALVSFGRKENNNWYHL